LETPKRRLERYGRRVGKRTILSGGPTTTRLALREKKEEIKESTVARQTVVGSIAQSFGPFTFSKRGVIRSGRESGSKISSGDVSYREAAQTKAGPKRSGGGSDHLRKPLFHLLFLLGEHKKKGGLGDCSRLRLIGGGSEFPSISRASTPLRKSEQTHPKRKKISRTGPPALFTRLTVSRVGEKIIKTVENISSLWEKLAPSASGIRGRERGSGKEREGWKASHPTFRAVAERKRKREEVEENSRQKVLKGGVYL